MGKLKLNILYQFNNKYAPYAGVSITSLFENNQHFDELTVYVFNDSQDPISGENHKKFKELSNQYQREIVILDTDPLIQIMKKTGIPKYRGSYSTNMKMFVSEILPNISGKLLYIDSDTIVSNKLDELAMLDMMGNCLAMSLDSLGQAHKYDIGMKDDSLYFNAGVILFDMQMWKDCHCMDKIIEHVKNVRAHYPAPDQDLINYVVEGKILTLSPKYNLQPIHMVYPPNVYLQSYNFSYYYSMAELDEARKKPCICHCFRYLGEFPWHKGNLHPCNNIFNQYLHMSPWSDYQKEKAKVGLVIKLEKILYRFSPRIVFIRIFKNAHKSFLKKANMLSLQNMNDTKM